MGELSVKVLIHEIGDRLQSVTRYRGFAEARMLLANVLGCAPDSLLIHDDQMVSDQLQEKIESLVSRRLNYEPMAYLVGEKEFFGLKFFVDSNVLIPRPESESLVAGVVKWVKAKNLTSGRILDLGTGSGCLAISLAKELGKNFKICGLEKSELAMKIAEKNRALHGFDQVSWLYGDIIAGPKMSDTFDIIVSNPPYIPAAEIPKLQEDIKNFEPKMALDGGAAGIDFYKPIFELWADKLKRPGLLALETMGPAQQRDLGAIYKNEKSKTTWSDGPHLYYEF